MFQDLSFDVHDTHVARGHMPQNVSQSWSMKIKNHKNWKKSTFQVKVSQLFVGIIIYMDSLASWAKKKKYFPAVPMELQAPEVLTSIGL